jgi:hypothetical protein
MSHVFYGHALDDRVPSSAEIDIHKQSCCRFDFLKRIVHGYFSAGIVYGHRNWN